jgi:hypothetical protein
VVATTRSLARALPLAIVLVTCSSGDDDTAGTTLATDPPSAASPAPDTAPQGSTGPPASTAPPTVAPESTAAPPSTGVPGLDSEDAFCAAWSRFGGSWQVLVQANFAGDPAEATRLEVVAAPLVATSFDDVLAAWPSELEHERELVADGYFGPFQRRSADALQALRESGASDDDIARLAESWSVALAAYDPMAFTIAVSVPPDLEQLVADAAALFAGRRVPIPEDPTMVIAVETPDTDAYLATACPDEGWIVGQDVDDEA